MKIILLAISVIFPLLVGTQIYSQDVVQNPSASTPSPPPIIATEQEVRQFFDQYVGRYTKMDLEGFLRLFSLKARQNQEDGPREIRMIYADLFDRSKSLQISLEDMKIDIYENGVETKARYTVNQVLKEGGEKKAWKGDIRWILVREEGNLQILSVDYHHSIPPEGVARRQPEAKEEPAKSAVMKQEILPIPLANEEEVKQFFSKYINRYNQKDLDGFLSFFSSKAVQNGKDGFAAIRNIYTKFFNQSRELRCQIEEMKIEIYQNSLDVKARFRVDQRLKKEGEEKIWKGSIRWVLVEENGNLKISSLDYQNDKSP